MTTITAKMPARTLCTLVLLFCAIHAPVMGQKISIEFPRTHQPKASIKRERTVAPPPANSHAGTGQAGQSLPGTWRPFSDSSPWNQTIPANAPLHPDSLIIMQTLTSAASRIRFGHQYLPPIWVVNSDNVPLVRVRSDKIFDRWDRDRRGWTDVGVPITTDMYPEPTKDGHIVLVDPMKAVSWEMSRFGFEGDTPTCTTFNIWDLKGSGVADSNEGTRWWARGGRGSGFPIIAGLLRPEELRHGEIRHALVFTFPKNRRGEDGKWLFIPPAARGDGKEFGRQYPVEGMRFQLDPSLTEEDFDSWGLSREGKIVARALQKYGMFDGDNGGAMAIQVQLLGRTAEENASRWEAMFPGLYKNVERIPTDKLRVVYTGEPIGK